MSANHTSLFRYWGKADPNYPREPKWHPLVYHCLDVAAVAGAWWDASPAIQRALIAAFSSANWAPRRLRAWVLFFVALHDLGKFDVRFQLKAEDALRQAWPGLQLGGWVGEGGGFQYSEDFGLERIDGRAD